MNRKSYKELTRIILFEDRVKYLMVKGCVGDITFGGKRQLNQILYKTDEWKRTRQNIIIRDNGCNLAHEDYPIFGSVYIHHINPITIEDILERRPSVFDPENLISTSFETHNLIHYGNENGLAPYKVVERMPNDTIPWR